jgi:hypothetical protein
LKKHFQSWHLSALCYAIATNINYSTPEILLPQSYLQIIDLKNTNMNYRKRNRNRNRNRMKNIIIHDEWVLYLLYIRKMIQILPSGCHDDQVCLLQANKTNSKIISNDQYRDHVISQLVNQSFLNNNKFGFYITENNNNNTDCLECIHASHIFQHFSTIPHHHPLFNINKAMLDRCSCLLKCRGRVELIAPIQQKQQQTKLNAIYTPLNFQQAIHSTRSHHHRHRPSKSKRLRSTKKQAKKQKISSYQQCNYYPQTTRFDDSFIHQNHNQQQQQQHNMLLPLDFCCQLQNICRTLNIQI